MKKELEQKVKDLNILTKGDYFLNIAYGKYALYENLKTGGARNVFESRTSKRQLYNMINAYYMGIFETVLESIENKKNNF